MFCVIACPEGIRDNFALVNAKFKLLLFLIFFFSKLSLIVNEIEVTRFMNSSKTIKTLGINTLFTKQLQEGSGIVE